MHIEINHLNQYYVKRQVLYDINLSISTGMFGLLGRNGAGKTTLLKTEPLIKYPSFYKNSD